MLVCADSAADEKYLKYASFSLSLCVSLRCVAYDYLFFILFFFISKCKNRTESLNVFFFSFFSKTNWKWKRRTSIQVREYRSFRMVVISQSESSTFRCYFHFHFNFICFLNFTSGDMWLDVHKICQKKANKQTYKTKTK